MSMPIDKAVGNMVAQHYRNLFNVEGLVVSLRECISALERTKTITVSEQWEVMARAENALSKVNP